MPASVGVVRSAEALQEIAPEWRALAEARGNAFVTPEWYSAWLEHVGRDARPWVPVVRRQDGSLVGLLPMVVSRRGRALLIRFAGSGLGDHFHPVARAEDEEEVAALACSMLARRRDDWSALVLRHVEVDAPWVDRLLVHGTGTLAVVEDAEELLPCIRLDGQSWEQLLGSYSRKLRGQLAYQQRVLEREHDVAFRAVADPETLASEMAAFFALHDQRHDPLGGTSLAGERIRGFHRAFAAAALARGWLRLLFLDVDGRHVAAWYGWRVGDRFAYYSGGFDPSWAGRSPGLLLLARSIRCAAEEGAREYDLLLGDEAYKMRFATGRRRVRTLIARPPVPLAGVSYGLRIALRRLGRRLPAGVRARLRPLAQSVDVVWPADL